MRIYIDGSIYSSAPSGGIFKYFNEILPRLSETPGNSVVVLTPKGSTPPPEAPGIEVQSSNLGLGRFLPRGPWRRVLSPVKQAVESALVRMRNRSSDPAVFHSAYYSLSPIPKLPQILTVYDAISEVLEEFRDLRFHQDMTELKRRSLPHADRLLAISQKTKQDIHSYFGISADKIDVTPLGIDLSFYQVRAPRPKTLPEQYFLYVGGRLNHKNFRRLAEAYALSPVRHEIPFVVAGTDWLPEETAWLEKLGVYSRFQLIRHPSDEEVRTLYQYAAGFFYPSLYEGFGMPILEAFASGVPVATSQAGSLPEVAGQGAIYFDPRNPESIAQAMESILDPSITTALHPGAQSQLREFSWEKTAQLTYQAYLKCLTR